MNNQSLFRHQAWTINASLVCALLLHACAAQVRDPADDATDPHVSEALATSKAITGTINSAGTSWVSHKMAMTGPTDVEATLSWTNTSADLNLYVYVDGVLKGYSNKSARPETVKLTGLVGKELSFGIKARSGGISSYSLAIKLTTPDPAPPPATSTTLTGSIDSGGTSWRSHKMTMTGPTDVNATLSWTNASADLNLYVYVDGVLKGYSNKSARPEVVKLSGLVGKELSFGIKARTGGVSAYSLAVVLSAPAAEPPPPPPPATCATDPFPGRPSAGKVLWGAAVSGNGDPTNRHEIPGGHPLSVRRTFFAWDKRATSMVTMARNDLTAGRIPWVSTKTPSWADMAAGKHDAEIDQMLLALDALPGPV
ncbi:MAG: hypothetical protein KC417_02830, partial [Myxococcales bacterium]|nr:hypothetical protein [Myxococcales bacterium]